MNDYGFRPGTLFWLANEEGYFPKASDVYNPNLPNNGNSNFGVEDYRGEIYWLHSTHGAIDLRLFYTGRPAASWSNCRWQENEQT